MYVNRDFVYRYDGNLYEDCGNVHAYYGNVHAFCGKMHRNWAWLYQKNAFPF